MKKLAAVIFLGVALGVAHGQIQYPYILNPLTVAPSGACAGPQIQVLNSNGHIYTCDAGTWTDITVSGSGTVTSVGLTFNADFSVSGSPVTTSGTFALDWATPPTGTGAMVRKTNAALVTPDLGTPSALAITNATGTCSACTANSATTVPAANITGVFTAAQSAPAFFAGTTAAGPYENYYEQFFGNPSTTATAIGAASGGNACTTALTTAADASHPVYSAAVSGTGGAATGESCVFESSVNSLPIFVNPNTTPAWVYETSVQPSVLPGTTAASYQAGTVTTSGVEPWTTGIGFHLSNSTGVANDWFCRYSSTEIDSTIAATVAWHRLRIVSDGVNVHWYIDGTERCGTGVAIASMPSGRMFPASSAVAGSATSVSLATSYYLAQRNSVR